MRLGSNATKIVAMLATILAALLATSSAGAESGELYESLDVRLGRLFMSPAERDRLEPGRGQVYTDESDASAGEEAADAGPQAPPPKPAAGIILAKGGRPLVWENGAFRRVSADIDEVEFPGARGIRIERGAPAAESSTEPQRFRSDPESDPAEPDAAPDP